MLSTLLQISLTLPVYATEDDSAIFIANGDISFTGKIHWICEGKISPLLQEDLAKAYRGNP